MSKFLKILGVIVFIGALGYAFVLFFVNPSTNNDKVTLTRSFYDNISEENLCETHFNPETVDYCVTYQSILEGETYEISDIVSLGDDLIVTITMGSTSDDFHVTFIEEDNTGIKGFFHKINYYIDTIE